MRIPVLVMAAALSNSAIAAEVSIKIDDAVQSLVMQQPALLDACVSGVMLRGDATVCKSVSQFLTALGNETKGAQVAAAKAAAEAKAAEEAKKAAEKPANEAN